jgi:O-antigen/teichoic acid export membrane protein
MQLFNFSSLKSIYVKNAVVLLSDNIIKIAVGFVLSVFVARSFGPGKFGQINYVMAVIGILQIFVLFGFEEIALKDIGLALYPEPIILGTIIKLRLILACIVYGVGLALFYFLFDKSLVFVYIILGLQLFMYSLYILKQWYQIKSLNKYAVIASQISFLFLSVTKIIFLILANDVLWYSVILASGTCIEISILFLFYKKKSTYTSFGSLDIIYTKHLFRASFPLLFQNLAIILYMKIDMVMIGKMLSAYQLGIYSVSVAISESIYFVPMAIANALYPKIAQARKENGDYESIIVKAGSLNVLVCLLFALGCTLFAPFLITTVYGSNYSPAGQVMQIHAWAGIPVAIGVSHSCYMIFNNLQKYALVATGSSAVLNIIGNFICIPMLGINGAAIATVVSYFFSTVIFYIFLKDKRMLVLRIRSLFFR